MNNEALNCVDHCLHFSTPRHQQDVQSNSEQCGFSIADLGEAPVACSTSLWYTLPSPEITQNKTETYLLIGKKKGGKASSGRELPPRASASSRACASASSLPRGFSASCLQTGHKGFLDDSHWSMHSVWNRWLQGSTLSFSPSLYTRPTPPLHPWCDVQKHLQHRCKLQRIGQLL